MTPAIRPAILADAPTLHALIQSAYRGESARAGWTHEADLIEGERISIDELHALLADPRQRFLIAEVDGDPLACVLVTDQGEGSAYFGLLAVSPARQAGGVGKHLIAAAEAHARSFGATRMELTAIADRAALIAYYQRRGYTLTGEERPLPVPAGRPYALKVMVKPLDAP